MSRPSIVEIIRKAVPSFNPTPMAARRIDGIVYKTTDVDEIMKLIKRDLHAQKIYSRAEMADIKKELERSLK